MPRSLTRREVLKGGVAAVGAGVVGGAVPAVAAAARRRERVAIVGAGAGGIAAAYFLAGSCDVEVFESRSRIGGHCDSRRVAYEGHDVTVDLGAQFFHPDTHPLYVTLLEQLGLDRQTHAATGSLCVFPSRAAARRGSPPPTRSTRCRRRSSSRRSRSSRARPSPAGWRGRRPSRSGSPGWRWTRSSRTTS